MKSFYLCIVSKVSSSPPFLQAVGRILGRVITRRSFHLKTSKHQKPKQIFPRIKGSSLNKTSPAKHTAEPKAYAWENIRRIYNILKYSTWDCAQEQLNCLSIKWDSYTVNQVLKTHPPMEKAWLFFNWAPGRKNFKHDQYTYTTMLDILGEARRISSMMYVFEEMKLKGIKIDVVTYTSLMHWLSNDGDVDGATKLWKEMRAKGCRPTIVTYTAYMRILFNHERIDDATAVYKELLESGLSPNCYTYTVLMDYLASSGKSIDALEVFSRMQDTGVQPDKAACNILIEIFCRTGEIWAILRILQYMKENFLVLRYPVYKKALETFKIAGESDMVLRQVNQHFNEEGTDGHDANPPQNDFDLENGLVLNLLSKKNLVAIDILVVDMIEKGVYLDTKVISKIIEVNSAQSRQNSALLAFRYSLNFGINIDRTAYLALIGLYIRTNSFQNVVEIVDNMVKQGLSLGTHLTCSLIYRLGCSGEAAIAEKVFDLLPDEKRNTAEFTALIGAYFSSGNADKGLEIFKTMKSHGVNVALGTFCVLIAGLEKCGKVHELQYYWKERNRLQAKRYHETASMNETICNLLFAGDFSCSMKKGPIISNGYAVQEFRGE